MPVSPSGEKLYQLLYAGEKKVQVFHRRYECASRVRAKLFVC